MSDDETPVTYTEYGDPDVPEEMHEYVNRVDYVDDSTLPELPRDEEGTALIATTDVGLPHNAVMLPVDRPEFESGLQHGVSSKSRWLAEWSMYMIKKYGERVFFKRN